jgi:hypothetical protein
MNLYIARHVFRAVPALAVMPKMCARVCIPSLFESRSFAAGSRDKNRGKMINGRLSPSKVLTVTQVCFQDIGDKIKPIVRAMR